MSTVRLVAVTAGLSRPSSARLLTDRLTEAVRRRLADQEVGAKAATTVEAEVEAEVEIGAKVDTEIRAEVEVTVEVEVETIELRELAVDIATAMVTGFPAGRLAEALASVARADALIAVTPIFTASYSGLFKSFFDVLDQNALAGTPTLIAATGGTARHSLALEHAVRPMFAYLRAPVVPTAVYAASEDWGNTGGLVSRIDRAAEELVEQLTGRGGVRGGRTGVDERRDRVRGGVGKVDERKGGGDEHKDGAHGGGSHVDERKAGVGERMGGVREHEGTVAERQPAHAPVDTFDDVVPFEQRFAAMLER